MSEKPQTILLKLDVSKIDNARLFKGAKGIYLDAVMVASTNSQYGDAYVVFQSVSKEEREKGVKGTIIGNGKFMPRKQDAPKRTAPVEKQEDDGTAPF